MRERGDGKKEMIVCAGEREGGKERRKLMCVRERVDGKKKIIVCGGA